MPLASDLTQAQRDTQRLPSFPEPLAQTLAPPAHSRVLARLSARLPTGQTCPSEDLEYFDISPQCLHILKNVHFVLR